VDTLAGLLPILLLVVAFYFFIVRPSRRRTEDARKVSGSLRVGAEVMTTAGLFGTVTALEDDRVELEIAPGVRVRYVRAAIATVVEPIDDLPMDSLSDQDHDSPGDTESTDRPPG
jgi:preprotein translocase subunit YajC